MQVVGMMLAEEVKTPPGLNAATPRRASIDRFYISESGKARDFDKAMFLLLMAECRRHQIEEVELVMRPNMSHFYFYCILQKKGICFEIRPDTPNVIYLVVDKSIDLPARGSD